MNHLKNKSVLMHDDFRFIYASELGGKPSPNSCLLLTYLNISEGDISTVCHHCNDVNIFLTFLATLHLLESQVCYLFVYQFYQC